MSPPWPDPRPSGAPEERPHNGQADSHSDEPRHDPPRDGLRCERPYPASLTLPTCIGKNQESRNGGRGRKNGPGMKCSEEREEYEHDDENSHQVLRWPSAPERVGFNIHIEVRNDHESDHNQSGNQDSGDEGRKEVQEFLKSKKIPGSFGRVGSE